MWLDSKAVNCPQKWGNFSPAEWALLGAIFAPEEPRVTDHVAEVFGLSHSEVVALVARIRESALQLAERLPGLLPSMEGFRRDK